MSVTKYFIKEVSRRLEIDELLQRDLKRSGYSRVELTTERSRFEKFRAGYLPRVGDPVLKSVKVAVADVQLKQGLFGIKVRILPPTVDFIDKPTMKTPPPSVAAPTTVQAPIVETPEVETEKEEPIGNTAQA